ncbi:MAG: DoxX family protein [Candidatus Bathyarchaeota archaeon]|nr:DoxX family protein [Candidatus Bathyarchaeota archaeon]
MKIYIKEFKPSAGLIFLRLFIGFRVIYGVTDNILSWKKMLEFSVFLQEFKFPFPLWCAIISVYLQFFSAWLIILGTKFRFGSAILSFNFLVAIIFVHLPLKDSIEAMTPALAILVCSATLFLTGPGKFALKPGKFTRGLANLELKDY